MVARQTPLLSRKRLRSRNRTIRIRTATNPNNKKKQNKPSNGKKNQKRRENIQMETTNNNYHANPDKIIICRPIMIKKATKPAQSKPGFKSNLSG